MRLNQSIFLLSLRHSKCIQCSRCSAAWKLKVLWPKNWRAKKYIMRRRRSGAPAGLPPSFSHWVPAPLHKACNIDPSACLACGPKYTHTDCCCVCVRSGTHPRPFPLAAALLLLHNVGYPTRNLYGYPRNCILEARCARGALCGCSSSPQETVRRYPLQPTACTRFYRATAECAWVRSPWLSYCNHAKHLLSVFMLQLSSVFMWYRE